VYEALSRYEDHLHDCEACLDGDTCEAGGEFGALTGAAYRAYGNGTVQRPQKV
jgi:hypothetical protein